MIYFLCVSWVIALYPACVTVLMEVDEIETRMAKLQEFGERVEKRLKVESDEDKDDDYGKRIRSLCFIERKQSKIQTS